MIFSSKVQILKPDHSLEYIQNNPIVITTFYKFCNIPNLELFRDKTRAFCQKNEILGTILLGIEGINATVSGSRQAIDALYSYFDQHECFNNILFKESYFKEKPFGKLKVKIRKEIVSIHDECSYNPGEYISPEEWDSFIKRQDIILVDTRNDFEYHIGTFKGAINPETTSFYEFREWCEKNIPNKETPVVGFCTGGIRCEKSTSWLKKQGYKNVYHLEGGILGYFIKTQNKNKMWTGDCFVFDDRGAVKSDLSPSDGYWVQKGQTAKSVSINK